MKQIFALGHLVIKTLLSPAVKTILQIPPKKQLQTLHNVKQQDHDAMQPHNLRVDHSLPISH